MGTALALVLFIGATVFVAMRLNWLDADILRFSTPFVGLVLAMLLFWLSTFRRKEGPKS